MKQRNKKTNKRHLNSTKPSVGFINLSEASKISPYSQEYISLLARKGKLSAQKFGRNWFTTKEAINNYLIDQGIKIILPKNLFNTSYKGKINKPFYFSNEEFINSPQEENENIYNNPKIVFAQMGIKDNLSDQSDQSDDQSKKEEVFNYFQTNVKEEEKKKEEEEKSAEEENKKRTEELEKSMKPIDSEKIKTMKKDLSFLKSLHSDKEQPKKGKNIQPEKENNTQTIKPNNFKDIKEEQITKQEIPQVQKIENQKLKEAETETIKNEKSTQINKEEEFIEKLISVLDNKFSQKQNATGFKKFNSFADKSMNSPWRMFFAAVVSIIVILLLVGGVSFGKFDAIAIAIDNFFKDADTLNGHFLGTHADEVLLLNKNGDISIYGHIETQGQMISFIESGTAPIVVYSTTTVKNLSAESLDGVKKEDITLSFVTKNGNITYQNLVLNGAVDIGNRLSVSGLATLSGGITTNGANLNLGLGTIVLTNRNLVRNLNSEMLEGYHISDIDLDLILSNGDSSSRSMHVGGIWSNQGVFTENLISQRFFQAYGTFRLGEGKPTDLGVIDTRFWGISVNGDIDTAGSLNVEGPVILTKSPSSAEVSGGTIYINPSSASSIYTILGIAVNGTEKFKIDASGNVTTAGSLSISGTTEFSDDVVLASPANLILNSGNITVSRLSAPDGITSTSTTGGSLGAGTYYYKITALNANGETTGSSEVSAVVDGVDTNAVLLAWDGVTGASSYRIYRATSTNDQNTYFTDTASPFSDTGASGTLGAVPASNTTGGAGTFAGDLSVSGTIVSNDILPATTTLYTLGNDTYKWANIYVATATIGNTIIIGTDSITATSTLDISSGGALNITGAAASTWKTATGTLTIESAGDIYASSTDDIILLTAGTERMRIVSSTGFIGIATSTPRYALDIYGGLAVGTGTIPSLYVASTTGYVGISTSSPSEALTVFGNILGSGNIIIQDIAAISTFQGGLYVYGTTTLGQATTSPTILTGYVQSDIIPYSDAIYELGTSSIRWQNIHTATATIGSTITIGSAAISGSTIDITAAGTSIWKTTSGGDLTIESADTLTASSTGSFLVNIAGTERMRIASSTGFVGIATNSPRYALDIYGGLAVGTGTTPSLYVASTTGYVGIGTTTPTQALSIEGNIYGSGNVVFEGTLQVATTTVLADVIVSGNLVPYDAGGTYYLGTGDPEVRWDYGYFGEINALNLAAASTTISGTQAQTFTINSDAAGDEVSYLEFYRGGALIAAAISWSADNDRFEINNPLHLTATGTVSGANSLNFVSGAVTPWVPSTNDITIQSAANIYASSTDDIILVTAGTERLNIDTLGNFILTGSATTTGTLGVQGKVTIDGDLAFTGDQTIEGTGTLTINPTGNLNFQSASYYIDESGYLTAAKFIGSELEYAGNITIDANGAGSTSITITNQGAGTADLEVEGDITVAGGKITLDTGETIEATTSNKVIITAGGNQVVEIDSTGVKINGVATTTGNFTIQGETALATTTISRLTVSGELVYSSTTNWDTSYAHSLLTSGNPHSVTKSDVGLSNVENIALSTWGGSENILTVGTIATGTWQGTAIADTWVANAITISDGIIGSNSISGTLTTTGTLTIGDNGDRIDINSNTWDVTNGVISGTTGITSSGDITLSGLTPSHFVTTGTGGLLGTSASLANLVSSLSDVTGSTGSTNLVLSVSPTFTGTVNAAALTLSSTLTMSGSVANIALGSNYLSGDGEDEGVFVNSSGYVGIGTTTSASLLTVGSSGSGFQVNSSGLVFAPDGAIGTPAYSFTEDTNTGMYRIGNDNIGFALNSSGELGLSITLLYPIANAGLSLGSDANEWQDLWIDGTAYMDAVTMHGNIVMPNGGTIGQAAGPLLNFDDTNNYLEITGANVGIGDTSPASLLTVGSGDLFQVNSSGDMVKIKNITYSWPSSQGSASTVLTNDGAGSLSWASAGSVTYQQFISSDTWTKPSGCKWVLVEVISGGGGGGGGAGSSHSGGGAGGGAGGIAKFLFYADDLGSTESVTVGSNGSGGAGGNNGDGVNGSDGGESSFGSDVVVQGGEGGERGKYSAGSPPINYGGDGGSYGSVRHRQSTASDFENAAGSLGGYAGGRVNGQGAERGGGAGGGCNIESAGYPGLNGGASILGGGGGGAGGSRVSSNNGGEGGTTGRAGVGGGGSAGTSSGAGGSGANGTYPFCGEGGGGGGGSSASIGGVGGAGGTPAGAGGGGGSGAVVGSAGGAGARGEIRVWAW